jgi:hypothetical protein
MKLGSSAADTELAGQMGRSAQNFMLIYEAPLHKVKFRVWCAMSATRIIGPNCFVRCNYTNVLHTLQQHFLSLLRLRDIICVLPEHSATLDTAKHSLFFSLLFLSPCFFF